MLASTATKLRGEYPLIACHSMLQLGNSYSPRFPRWLLQLPKTVAPVAVARKFVHDSVVCMAISFFIGLILRLEALLSGHFEH